MAIKTSRITNANIYLDGANFLGRAEEIELPDIKIKMTEHKALGMIGTIELPAGIEKMEMKIKWNSYYADVFDKITNPYAARQIQIRKNVEDYTSAGRTAQIPLVTFVIGYFKNVPLGKFKQHDNAEFESMITATYIKQIYNGAAKIEYDAMSNIYKVNGVDIFDDYHINTGG